MLEFIEKNKEWIFSGIGVFLLGLIVAVLGQRRRSRDKTDARIQQFVENFRTIYKNDGHKLEVLIPAGINTLKTDREIKRGFEALMNIIPNHPLRNWKNRVEKVGYKRFINHIVISGRELNKHSIGSILKELEN